jgi:hypothetical protein
MVSFSRVVVGLVLCLGMVLSVPVRAQNANPFLGKWLVSWDGAKGKLEANLEISDSGGFWKTMSVASKTDMCAGREAPIRVDSVEDKKIQFTIRYSEALAGCADSKVSLALHDDGRISGERSGGRVLSLTRR